MEGIQFTAGYSCPAAKLPLSDGTAQPEQSQESN